MGLTSATVEVFPHRGCKLSLLGKNKTFHTSVSKCNALVSKTKQVSEWKFTTMCFSFQTSTLLFHLTFFQPSLTLSLRLMAGIKFCSAAKSQVNLGLKLHGCLCEALIYPQRERGENGRAIEHISYLFLPLCEWGDPLVFLQLTVFECCQIYMK